MPTTTENLENPLFTLGKFMYSYESLRMLARAPMEGYYVPWTAGIGRGVNRMMGRGVLPMAGRGIAFGGPVGMQATREAARIGIGRTAGIALGGKAGTYLTSGAATKLLIGKAVGIGLGALHLYWGAQLLALPTIIAYHGIAQKVRAARGLEMGGYFPETKMSLTSRQRTVRAITASRLQARSAIGSEAMLFHR